MERELEMLRKEYKNVTIPKSLDAMVTKTLMKKQKRNYTYLWPASAAVAALLLMATVNFSPDVAHAMSKIPFVKGVVDVITFTEFEDQKGHSSIAVKTPAITGLENKTLEGNLNQTYIEESQKLFEEFTSSLTNGEEHFAIDSDYKKVTETSSILSIQRTIQRTEASGYVQNQYVTIDKENQALITLKSLFKDEQYVTAISENIKEQMKKQMKADANKIYWITDVDMQPFTQINPHQQFYINADDKLVISFNEYDVAPGYMGAVEFIIPTKVISDILVGDRYIH